MSIRLSSKRRIDVAGRRKAPSTRYRKAAPGKDLVFGREAITCCAGRVGHNHFGPVGSLTLTRRTPGGGDTPSEQGHTAKAAGGIPRAVFDMMDDTFRSDQSSSFSGRGDRQPNRNSRLLAFGQRMGIAVAQRTALLTAFTKIGYVLPITPCNTVYQKCDSRRWKSISAPVQFRF